MYVIGGIIRLPSSFAYCKRLSNAPPPPLFFSIVTTFPTPDRCQADGRAFLRPETPSITIPYVMATWGPGSSTAKVGFGIKCGGFNTAGTCGFWVERVVAVEKGGAH